MRTKSLIACVCLIFCISCYHQDKRKRNQKSDSEVYLPDYMTSIVKKYDLPYGDHLAVDSSGLLFYYSGHFDTTYLLHVRKNGQEIDAVFYEVLPAFHRDDEDYADKEKQLLFFDGYSFKVNSVEWRNMIDNANQILSRENVSIKNEACADCPFYFIAHNFKAIKSDSENRSLFVLYSKYLNDSLIKQYVMKRSLKMSKSYK